MTDSTQRTERQAEQVRSAIIRAFEQAYEDAGLRGLCAEGRYEAAMEAARNIELRAHREAPEQIAEQRTRARRQTTRTASNSSLAIRN